MMREEEVVANRTITDVNEARSRKMGFENSLGNVK